MRNLSLCVLLCSFCLVGYSSGADTEAVNLTLDRPAQQLTPQQDDATLHDVTFIGKTSGWAVGDRGAIWKTEDAGATWNFVPSVAGVEQYSLRSVCFLTNHVGWVCGGSVVPYTQTHTGVILFTRDGGEKWSRLDNNQLPYLRSIQFFDLENGITLGERSTSAPAGMLKTTDGGVTWHSVNAEQSASWNGGEFFSSTEGVVVGKQGRHGIFANNHLSPGSNVTHGLAGLQDVSIDHAGNCWLVGQGALCLTSPNRGVSWNLPRGPFSKELRDFADLNSISHRGEHVWIAGSPGSVIWHSSDNGAHWESQPTLDSTPLRSIHFADEQLGVAVGDMGRICVTHDGGQHWHTTRGGGRRLACLAVHAHATRTPVSFLTRWSKEAGFRCGVSLATRGDVGTDAHAATHSEIQLNHATMISHGNFSAIDWRLPLLLPGLARHEDKLLEEWSMLTDRRLPDVLIGHFVAQLRTWKPDVLLLDEPPQDDIATQLIHKAVLRAVQQARDPHYYPQHLRLAGLHTWSVKKIVQQRPAGSSGKIRQQPFEILPHLATTLDLASAEATNCLGLPTQQLTNFSDYQVLLTDTPQVSQSSIFSDLKLLPDSAARRAVPSVKTIDYDALIAQSNHRRTISNISQNLTQRPDGGAQLLGQIRQLMKSLTQAQAAAQLADLADQYRQQDEWALAEETYAELITYYADQPQALTAMLWLTKFWTSTELNWQRLQSISGSSNNTRNQEALVNATFEQAEKVLKENATRLAGNSGVSQLIDVFESDKTPLITTSGDLNSVVHGGGIASSQRMLLLRRRQEMALAVMNQLEQTHPRLFEDPEMQFILASLSRRRSVHKTSDEIYDRFLQLLNDDPWHLAAKGETWLLRPGALSPKPVVECQNSRIAPVLDGDLSDPCWIEAEEIQLGAAASSETYVGPSGGRVEFVGQKTIVMFSHDDKFLYLAATVPIDPELPDDEPQQGGRTHDADLGLRDQLHFQFDVDRDYATYYEFQIDQSGACRESCWDSENYDPQWFISTKRDHNVWRMEAAIPIDQLVPSEGLIGSTWALGVTRVMPGVGSQSWTDSGAEAPNAPRFGFIRFRN